MDDVCITDAEYVIATYWGRMANLMKMSTEDKDWIIRNYPGNCRAQAEQFIKWCQKNGLYTTSKFASVLRFMGKNTVAFQFEYARETGTHTELVCKCTPTNCEVCRPTIIDDDDEDDEDNDVDM